jgi:hypothetical protein
MKAPGEYITYHEAGYISHTAQDPERQGFRQRTDGQQI